MKSGAVFPSKSITAPLSTLNSPLSTKGACKKMSYCVNCGVELDRSLTKCPLCSTPVINPNDIDAEKTLPTYPVEYMQNIEKKLRFASANLVTVIFLTALVLCPFCNYVISDKLTWSRYVMPSIIFAWCCAVPPIMIRKNTFLKCVIIDFISAFIYLGAMNMLTTPNINWFVSICVPILLYLFGTFILIYSLSVKKCSVIYIISIGFALAGIFCMMTEYFLRRFRFLEMEFIWSVPVLISCIGIAVLMLIIEKLSKVSALRKRLHI